GVERVAVGAEIVRRAHHQELLGPGESLDLDRQQLSNGAAAAVGADEPRRLEGAGNPVGLDADLEPLAFLLEADDAMAEIHLHARLLAKDVELDRRQPVLLEVQAVRVGGDVRENPEVEFGDLAAVALPDLPAA